MNDPLKWLIRMEDTGVAPINIGGKHYRVSLPNLYVRVTSPTGETKVLPFDLAEQSGCDLSKPEGLVAAIATLFNLSDEDLEPKVTTGRTDDGMPYVLIPSGADIPPELAELIGKLKKADGNG